MNTASWIGNLATFIATFLVHFFCGIILDVNSRSCDVDNNNDQLTFKIKIFYF